MGDYTLLLKIQRDTVNCLEYDTSLQKLRPQKIQTRVDIFKTLNDF